MKSRLAEFGTADAMVAAARAAAAQGFVVRDALTPYPAPSVNAAINQRPPRLRPPMAMAGFGVALFAFALESWTAVYAYPFNSGGRPPFSWPVFILVPFEVGVLAAGAAGFVAFLLCCGLPGLHHPIFEAPGIERASTDRFFLILERPPEDRSAALDAMLWSAGAMSIGETNA